jgi:hypothetical protein
MERGSDQHGQRLDEELKHETSGLRTGAGSTHTEEYLKPEPSGESQPDVERAPEGVMGGGTSEQLNAEQVERRSEIARWLDPAHFPAVREVLISDAADNEAPDDVLAQLKALPAGREYLNIEDVFESLARPS